MDRVTLYEELRLIERNETEVSTAWKGAHLLLFFLAFVFGSFCTFCFNMLMYLFDEKCVLFPKLLSLNSLRHNVIYEFIPEQNKKSDPLPVDFLSTQFVHKSACYLPTYVPLVSGIFGLVWTTMFLMCSSGSRGLSGLQRPWRVILPVLVFSVPMSCLCIYSSAVTHYGLQDLCTKLGEITGSTSCTYTVNVATLAYERQIRGVYQKTRLTITSAWMHTACWVASAVLAVIRILLAVDFRLVKIRAELIGDLDRMLEQNEEHLQTVMPGRWTEDGGKDQVSNVFSYFKNEHYDNINEFGQLIDVGSDILFISEQQIPQSNQALLPEEQKRLSRVNAYESTRAEHRFIVTLLFDLLDTISYDFISSSTTLPSSTELIARQFGQQTIASKTQSFHYLNRHGSFDTVQLEGVIKDILPQKPLKETLTEPQYNTTDDANPTLSTSKKKGRISLESLSQTTEGKSRQVKSRSKSMTKKSNLRDDVKDVSIQTEKKKKKQKKQKVTIVGSTSQKESDSSSDSKKDENIQTDPKEKQD